MAPDLVDLPLDLYRRNAFRMLGLPTESSFKAVTRRAQKLNTAIEMSDAEGIAELVLATFMGMPDEPAVRLSSSRLGDPYQRLIDELFWLRVGENDEPTAQRLRGRGAESIVELLTSWEIAEEGAEGDAALRATHNLAVFYHMLAIEIEQKIAGELKAQKPGVARLKALKSISAYCWQVALPRWRAVLAADATWDWLHERAGKIDKRRLKRNDVELLRREAEGALLGIVVQLMVPAANRGWTEEVDRIRLIARNAGVDDRRLASATKQIVGASIDDIDKQIKTFTSRLAAEKSAAKVMTRQLMDELEPKLKAFRLLLEKGDARLAALEDSFSDAANDGQLAHWSEKKDDDFSLQVLKRIKPYIHSPQLLARVDEDLEITLCYFCKARPRRQSSAYTVSMWYNVRPRLGGGYSWTSCPVPVPRCEECARKGASRGAEQHSLVMSQLASGWRIGNEPSPEEARAALRNAPLSRLGLLGRI